MTFRPEMVNYPVMKNTRPVFELIETAEKTGRLAPEEWCTLLSAGDPEARLALRSAASRVRVAECGDSVAMRGLVEVGNICVKNCLYCGIRRDNIRVPRFELDLHEIVDTALLAGEYRYGSVVLQSGERTDRRFVDKIAEAVAEIKANSSPSLGVTLSCGEQEKSVYREWFAAGSHRYLLRIESSNPEIYARIHPADHSFTRRLECLEAIRECGYQLGTGIMCGLPGQSAMDLVRDVEFFASCDADMIGMGPYLVQSDTPMAGLFTDFESRLGERLESALDLIAVTRLRLRDVNIASTTALQAMAPDGRERGLLAGANVLMPNLTPTRFRAGYQLYDGKPGLDENAAESRDALRASVEKAGFRILEDAWGDSPHFQKKR